MPPNPPTGTDGAANFTPDPAYGWVDDIRAGQQPAGTGRKTTHDDDRVAIAEAAALARERNLAAEAAVLGSMLLDNSAIADVANLLSPTDFYSTAHQKIFAAILRLHEAGTPADIMTLYNELRTVEQVELVGGLAYLTTLEQHVITTANVLHHVKIVKALSERRLLSARLVRARELVASGDYDAAQVAETLREAIEQGAPQPETLPPIAWPEYKAHEWPDADCLWGGLIYRGEITLVYGPPKVSKSILSENLAIRWANNDSDFLGRSLQPARVLLIQDEIPDAHHRNRLATMIGAQADVGDRLVIVPKQQVRLFAVNGSNPVVTSWRGKLEHWIETHKPDVIIIDPVCRVLPAKENDQSSVAVLFDYLEELAARFNVALLLVHHARKTIEGASVDARESARGSSEYIARPAAVVHLQKRGTHLKVNFACRHTRDEETEEWSLDYPWLQRLAQSLPTEIPQEPRPRRGADAIQKALTDGTLRYSELIRRLIESARCSQRTAERRIGEAVATGQITKSGEWYGWVGEPIEVTNSDLFR